MTKKDYRIPRDVVGTKVPKDINIRAKARKHGFRSVSQLLYEALSDWLVAHGEHALPELDGWGRDADHMQRIRQIERKSDGIDN